MCLFAETLNLDCLVFPFPTPPFNHLPNGLGSLDFNRLFAISSHCSPSLIFHNSLLDEFPCCSSLSSLTSFSSLSLGIFMDKKQNNRYFTQCPISIICPHLPPLLTHSLRFLKRFYLFIYFQTEGKEGRKVRRETSICERYIDWLPLSHSQLLTWPATQACALTGNGTGDPLVCRPALNLLSHTSQD